MRNRLRPGASPQVPFRSRGGLLSKWSQGLIAAAIPAATGVTHRGTARHRPVVEWAGQNTNNPTGDPRGPTYSSEGLLVPQPDHSAPCIDETTGKERRATWIIKTLIKTDAGETPVSRNRDRVGVKGVTLSVMGVALNVTKSVALSVVKGVWRVWLSVVVGDGVVRVDGLWNS